MSSRKKTVLVFLSTLVFLPGWVLAQELSIGNYQLVSTERVGRTHYLYTYKADVINAGADVKAVTATAKSNSPYTEVVDATLSFGDVPALATVKSSDTFQIKQDRLYKFDFLNLEWTIEATHLEPDEVVAAVLRDVQAGNLQAAATKFRTNDKIDFLMSLTPLGREMLVEMMTGSQLVYDGENFREYEKTWIDPEGRTRTLKFNMTRNALGQWKIAGW